MIVGKRINIYKPVVEITCTCGEFSF